jgi:hypothetical protein
MQQEQLTTESTERKTTPETRTLRRPRIPRSVIVRLGRLLRMEYRPAELAEELGCGADTIYRHYLPAGCPHRRDERGHIWIVGTDFAEWVRATLKQGKTPMTEGEAYCLKCNRPVNMKGRLEVEPVNYYLELVKGECPACGTTVNRARARKRG